MQHKDISTALSTLDANAEITIVCTNDEEYVTTIPKIKLTDSVMSFPQGTRNMRFISLAHVVSIVGAVRG
jgi:hypothetical protein